MSNVHEKQVASNASCTDEASLAIGVARDLGYNVEKSKKYRALYLLKLIGPDGSLDERTLQLYEGEMIAHFLPASKHWPDEATRDAARAAVYNSGGGRAR